MDLSTAEQTVAAFLAISLSKPYGPLEVHVALEQLEVAKQLLVAAVASWDWASWG